MKRLFWLLAVLGMYFAVTPHFAAGNDPLDPLNPLIFPEIEYKYVQFLPNGHLGKNKPRYGKFDWQVLESKHFEIYAYGSVENLAEMFLDEAEKTYSEFSARFNMNAFSEKIRVVIYNSARDFEETNIVFSFVPQGLGGLTEMLEWKRVLIAFRDSPAGFKRLLRHELTHRYQTELLKLTKYNIIGSDVPLWFVEGVAEYMAHQWDAEGELMVRDAYLNNYLCSVTDEYWYYGRLVYKQGEFVAWYLAKHYQKENEEDVISAILRESSKMKFKEAFRKVTGKTLEEFEKELRQYVEGRYSSARLKKDIVDYARKVDNGILLASQENFFITKKEVFGRDALFLNWIDNNKIYSKKIAESGRIKTVDLYGFPFEISPEFGYRDQGASFLPQDNSLGKLNGIVYAANKGGKDKIAIQYVSFDSKKKKIVWSKEKTYCFDSIKDIQQPIAINSEEIAFIGRERVFAEIYLFNRKTDKLEKISSMKRTYRNLSYSKFFNALVASVENEKTQSYDLALCDLNKREWRLLAETPENEFYPEFSPDGSKLLYVSDKGLVHNIYLYDFSNNSVSQLTDVKVGVFRPKWLLDSGMLFNSYFDGKISLMAAAMPQKVGQDNQEIAKSSFSAQKNDDSELSKEFYPPDSMTIFGKIVSLDKTKALFLENRKLSLKALGKDKSEIGFYLVDLSNKTTHYFTFEDADRLEDFGKVEFLVGTNFLIHKTIKETRQETEYINGEAKEKTAQIEYAEAYVYDWIEKKSYKIKSDSVKEPKIFRVSPDGQNIILGQRRNFALYGVFDKKDIFSRKFDDLIDAVFISTKTILLLEKIFDRKQPLRLLEFDIEAKKERNLNFEFSNKDFSFKESFMNWHVLADKKGIYFFTKVKKGDGEYFNVWFFDFKSSAAIAQSHLETMRNVKFQNDVLELETENFFGVRQKLLIDKNTTSIQEEQPQYNSQDTYSFINPNSPLNERIFNSIGNVKKKIRQPRKYPKLYQAYGVAGIFWSGRRISGLLAMDLIALDELNNKALVTNIILDGWLRGYADINWYNFATGNSFEIDYWHFRHDQQRLAVGASKNIFLHPFLNWDVNLKEQYSRAGNWENWSTRAGTSFSIDTTVSDWHGPHSGAAVFSEIESGINSENLRYQATDINLDARYYFPLTGRSGFAFRIAGGNSIGPCPTRFVWGGNKTFRGIPLFSQTGNGYIFQSSEFRFPIFDVIGAKISGPIDYGTQFFTRYFDVRGGIYNDVGDMWYRPNQITALESDHNGFKLQYSTGFFVNVPWILGNSHVFNFRFSKGLFGQTGWNFWLGYNW